MDNSKRQRIQSPFPFGRGCSLCDLLSSLRLAQAKIKIGFSSSSQPGYRLGNGWRALKFSPARQINSGLTSDKGITLEGQ